MSSIDKGYSEKRDFIRMKISAPLSAKLSHDAGVIEGTCRDLSGGGMQVDSPSEIPQGTELVVEISSDHGHNPTLHAKARVARCAADPSSKGYSLGLEIIEVLR
jgi:c-di-GMP-binding flagellar brake protein YcgR